MTEFIYAARQNIGEGLFNILLQPTGFQGRPLNPSHFYPLNEWIRDENYLIDGSNGDRYIYDSVKVKRYKCLALVAVTPLMQTIASLFNLANRITKVVTLCHFWNSSMEGKSLQQRLTVLLQDVLRIALTPIFLIGLLFAAVYGVFSPYDGGKIYSAFERSAYQRPLIAPCFEPFAITHLGGGDILQPDQW